VVLIRDGILENVCPFASRCHSEDAGGSWRDKTMITVFFIAKKLITFDVLPRGSTFNRLYFINNIFPDLKIPNLKFRRQKTGSAFWVHMDNSMRHSGSKATPKIKKHFQNAAPTLFTRYKPVRLLVLWDVKLDPKRSRVFLEWWN
jgi:hypothetical protein